LPQQVGKARIHGGLAQHGQVPVTPRRFCITGLVVVYCRNCFFSG
jgi:hypothetical protein